MDLEQQCNDGDMHVSTASIPIIREERAGIVEENSPAKTQVIRKLEERLEDPTILQWPPVVYAPLGDAEFWLDFHNAVVGKALRQLHEGEIARQIAEARIPLIQNDLYKQFTDKTRLIDELKAQKDLNEADRIEYAHQTALIIAKYINLVYIMGIAQDQHETRISDLKEEHELQMHLALLYASNEVESKENIIKMYEERFGSREKLMKLAQAEENCEGKGKDCQRSNYNCISRLIKQHETGKCPKTVSQRMADFAEKLLSPKTYAGIVSALYAAFRGKEKDIDGCG